MSKRISILLVVVAVLVVGSYFGYAYRAQLGLSRSSASELTDQYGEACVPLPPVGVSTPAKILGQCLSTSTSIVWADIADQNAVSDMLFRSVDNGPWKKVHERRYNCHWEHIGGYVDLDVSSGHTYQYKLATDVVTGTYSNIITCPAPATPAPIPVPGAICPSGTAICGLQNEVLKKMGLESGDLCGVGVGHGAMAAYDLRFGHANYDPASGLLWNIPSGNYYDYTTWSFGRPPPISVPAFWCGTQEQQAAWTGGGSVAVPAERPSIDAWQIKCFYSYYLYTQGKATWNDVTGGINYDAYPLCGRCKNKTDCADASKVLPAVYKWRPAPLSALPAPKVPQLTIDGVYSATKKQTSTFVFSVSGLSASKTVTQWVKNPGTSAGVQVPPSLQSTADGKLFWQARTSCANAPGTYTIWVVDTATGKKSNEVKEIISKDSSCSGQGVTPAAYGLKEGDVVSAAAYGDPDVFIINNYGYKRLFLNEIIFRFYGHLGGFSAVKSVTPATRDAFLTSLLFKNCETNDPTVWALQVTGADSGMLHRLDITHDAAVAQDANFDTKTFCINNNEFNWYPKGTPYTSLSQVR